MRSLNNLTRVNTPNKRGLNPIVGSYPHHFWGRIPTPIAGNTVVTQMKSLMRSNAHMGAGLLTHLGISGPAFTLVPGRQQGHWIQTRAEDLCATVPN